VLGTVNPSTGVVTGSNGAPIGTVVSSNHTPTVSPKTATKKKHHKKKKHSKRRKHRAHARRHH
jgi:hypothetical protein